MLACLSTMALLLAASGGVFLFNVYGGEEC